MHHMSSGSKRACAIVTDGGAQTAAQIEALREQPRRIGRKSVPIDDAAA